VSKSYIAVFHLYSWIGQLYYLGAEPEADKGREPTPDPLGSDCSGAQGSALDLAHVLFGGKTMEAAFGAYRPTADTFYHHCSRISTPTQFGDYFFHVHGGNATHIGAYVGRGFTIESGDGTGHVARHTVAWQNARGAVWGRLPANDLEHILIDADPHPVLPNWPTMGSGYVGWHARCLKSLLNQIQAAGLTISYSATGNTVGPGTVKQINRFRANHGLAQNGKCDAAMLRELIKALGL
jgi:hypothetical protein